MGTSFLAVVSASLFLGLSATASATVVVSNTADLQSAVASAVGNETIVLAGGVTYSPSAPLVVSVAGLKIQGPTSGGMPAILSGGSVDQTTFDGDIIDIKPNASLTLSNVSLRDTVTGATAAIDDQGSLDLESSDVQGNQVSPIFADGGTAVIRNSTIADNSFANSVAGVNDSGGGDVKLFNDTIAYNDFGLANAAGGGTAELVNTMIVKNTHQDCTAHVTTADASMDSAGTCGGGTLTGITQQASPGITASPGVGANGGTTQTIALLAGSPAIAGGDFTGTNCPATDQRGIARTGHCDVGAFQLGASLSAAPTTVAGGAPDTVSWSGVAAPSPTDWVGVYQDGQTGASFVNWFYAGSCGYTAGAAEAASGSCPFTMPTAAGPYDFILYAAGSFTVLAFSNPVTVSGGSGLTASPASVNGGGTETVSWTSVGHPTPTDWVGVYPAGQSGGSFVDWFYAGSCGYTSGAAEAASGSCQYAMPNVGGSYDFILYAQGSFSPLMQSNTVTVTATAPTLTAAPASVGPGGTETVTWSGVASPSPTDWVGVYVQGQSGGSFVNWFYAGSCGYTAGAAEAASGSCSTTMPTAAGTYDFILYTAGSFHALMTSNTVTVT
jgi:hypothetical protein